MLKKTVMLFLALILIISASAVFAAEMANGKTGKAVKKLYFPLREYMVRQKTMQRVYNALKFRRLDHARLLWNTVRRSDKVRGMRGLRVYFYKHYSNCYL